jgi:predicted adenylyl cyclase CyaB
VVEVELKARLRDREAAEAAVAAYAAPAGALDKRDSYWHGPDWRANRGTKGFRVRSEGKDSVVTFKTKRVEGGIEINREVEFGISDRSAFLEFAQRLGCEPFYDKRKTGEAFKVAASPDSPFEATVEIVEIGGLGDFIEIEILLESAEPGAVAAARKELLELLGRAGCAESDIESRFYSELLMEAGIVARP